MKPILDAAGAVGAMPLGDGQPLPPHDPAPRPRRTSIELLYRAQAPKLLRMFVRRADRNDAHDLVQDSFVQRRCPRFKRDDVLAWMETRALW